ncbi:MULTISPECIES: hypothetical protein [unclassified Paraflavitalea]|uniref:hypothetical protein n=1 Tax=unclassified Paraflavitalea TaxID=2798305 RepID=UPI003D33E594
MVLPIDLSRVYESEKREVSEATSYFKSWYGKFISFIFSDTHNKIYDMVTFISVVSQGLNDTLREELLKVDGQINLRKDIEEIQDIIFLLSKLHTYLEQAVQKSSDEEIGKRYVECVKVIESVISQFYSSLTILKKKNIKVRREHPTDEALLAVSISTKTLSEVAQC